MTVIRLNPEQSEFAKVFGGMTNIAANEIEIDEGVVGLYFINGKFHDELKNTFIEKYGIFPLLKRKHKIVLFNIREIELNLSTSSKQPVLTKDMVPVFFQVQLPVRLQDPYAFMQNILKRHSMFSNTDLEATILAKIFPVIRNVVSEYAYDEFTLNSQISHRINNFIFHNLHQNEAETGLHPLKISEISFSMTPKIQDNADILEIGDVAYSNLSKDYQTATWSWSAKKEVLTLSGYQGSAIRKKGDLELHLSEGCTNKVTNNHGDGINVTGHLKITGKGGLIVSASSDKGRCRGILADDLFVEAATLSICSEREGHGISVAKNAEFRDAKILSTGNGKGFSGIYTNQGDIRFIGKCRADIISDEGVGIFSGKNICVDQGEINTQGNGECGIFARQVCTFCNQAIVITSSSGQNGHGISCEKLELTDGSQLVSNGKIAAISCLTHRISHKLSISAGENPKKAAYVPKFASEPFIRIS
ncbi:MAG: SPFH domain-containing protein [Candidatus Cloacimonetes bacterium]|nr:SPFH domain-containing protein [Candidatus Cloacimonadota bacterium]